MIAMVILEKVDGRAMDPKNEMCVRDETRDREDRGRDSRNEIHVATQTSASDNDNTIVLQFDVNDS
jgi:hypothetical protein